MCFSTYPYGSFIFKTFNHSSCTKLEHCGNVLHGVQVIIRKDEEHSDELRLSHLTPVVNFSLETLNSIIVLFMRGAFE